MSGARPEADPRFAFHGFWERAEHDADGRGSFAAADKVNVGQVPRTSQRGTDWNPQ